PRLLRRRRSAGALPAELLSVHRAVGRSRYRLLAGGRRIEDRGRRRLAGNPRVRHGSPAGPEELRHRPRRVSGVCLRHGDRARRDAEIRHPRSAHLLRFRSALAPALRVSAARHSGAGARAPVWRHPGARRGGMKTTLSWLKTHLDTEAGVTALAERLVMLGHDVESVADRAG